MDEEYDDATLRRACSVARLKVGEAKDRQGMRQWQFGRWQFLLSYGPPPVGWIFSASLQPLRQTSSRPCDWKLLGAVAAAVGVPAAHFDTPLGDTIRKDPGGVHKWAWRADGTPAFPVPGAS